MFWGGALTRPRAGSFCAVVACAAAVAGCGSTTSSGSAVNVAGTKLTVYAGQPPAGTGGAAATDVLDAEKLALAKSGGKVGKFTVTLKTLDGREISANARTAIQDNTAIAYLGEVVPGTSQDSVPITNELGILEVSPTDTAAYLTQSVASVSDSPGTFYPSSSSYHQTFARVVPSTAAEAKATVAKMRSAGVAKLYVSSDTSDYGKTVAAEVRAAATAAGVSVTSSAAGADGIFYGSNVPATAAHAVSAAAASAPSAKLFVPSALYDPSFVSGLPAAAQKNLYVSAPGFTTAQLSPSGKAFVSAFKLAYGHTPAPQAIFGFEAMSALVSVLQSAGNAANSRSVVVNGFRTLKNRSSVLGTYSITNGDTSIAPFVFARVQGGTLVPGS